MDYSDKKVVFVTGSLTGGGAEKVISILASSAAEMGADVTLIILRKSKISYTLSNKVNCVQIELKKNKVKSFSRIIQLHKLLKLSKANAVISFLPIVSLYVLLANIGVGKKLIFSERADPNISVFDNRLNFKDKIGNLCMRKLGLFNCAHWMVFQTEDAQKYYNRRLQNKSSIIANPLDVEKLPEVYKGIREKKIVAVGRFSQEKNFALLIECFAEFHKKHSDYTLTIFGEGPLRSAYEEQIKCLKLQKYVELPGFSKHLNKYIYKAAVYVSTSNHEGISNSMIEALGMGIPTIVTDCPIGGAKMFVKNGINGILISMNDKNALIDALCKLAENPSFAKELSAEASKVREELDSKIICGAWLELV